LLNCYRWRRSGRQQRGPGGGDGWADDTFPGRGSDGRADSTVLGRGSDGDDGGGGRGGGGVVLTTEEERDDAVSGHDGEGRADGVVPGSGDGMQAVEVATAWTRWRRRRRGKFWLPDIVQVKILQLGFKDQTTRGFIGTTQKRWS
jgi:hypothetical protein